MCYDLPVKNAFVNFPIKLMRNLKCISGNSLSPQGTQNKDIGAAKQILLSSFKFCLGHRLVWIICLLSLSIISFNPTLPIVANVQVRSSPTPPKKKKIPISFFKLLSGTVYIMLVAISLQEENGIQCNHFRIYCFFFGPFHFPLILWEIHRNNIIYFTCFI